jgi:hypothetical protein
MRKEVDNSAFAGGRSYQQLLPQGAEAKKKAETQIQ